MINLCACHAHFLFVFFFPLPIFLPLIRSVCSVWAWHCHRPPRRGPYVRVREVFPSNFFFDSFFPSHFSSPSPSHSLSVCVDCFDTFDKLFFVSFPSFPHSTHCYCCSLLCCKIQLNCLIKRNMDMIAGHCAWSRSLSRSQDEVFSLEKWELKSKRSTK